MVSKFQWNCSECTFFHNYHFPRCQMCGAERKFKNCERNLPISVNAIDRGKSNKDAIGATEERPCSDDVGCCTTDSFPKNVLRPLHDSFNDSSDGGTGKGNWGDPSSNHSSLGGILKNVPNPFSKRLSQGNRGCINDNFQPSDSSSDQTQQNNNKSAMIQMKPQHQNTKSHVNFSSVGNSIDFGSDTIKQNNYSSTPSTQNPYQQSSRRINPYARGGKRNLPMQSAASPAQQYLPCNQSRQSDDQISHKQQQLDRLTLAHQMPPHTPTATYLDERNDIYSRNNKSDQNNHPQHFSQRSSIHGTAGERNNNVAATNSTTNSFFQPGSQRRQQQNQWQNSQKNQQQQQLKSPDGRQQPLGDLFFRQSTPRCKE